MAASIHGLPVVTFDVDIVYEISDENIDRLLEALTELGAHFRQKPELQPRRAHLVERGHKLMMTSTGPLDVLGYAGMNRDFASIAADAMPLAIPGGATVLTASLATLALIKREVGRPKDLAMLQLIEARLRQG
jgi:hypothetical protein